MDQGRSTVRVPLILTLLALGLAAGMIAAGASAPAQSNTLVDLTAAWTPQTMDPHWMYDIHSARVATQVYERLVQRDGASDGQFVPGLATGWQVSPAGDTFTFTIRSGVAFHQGGTLAPHDVAYSFWRGLLQDRLNGPMWMWLEAFFNVFTIEDVAGDDLARCQAVKAAITADDVAGTVTFHLAKPRGDWIAMLESYSASILDQEWMAASGGWGGDCADWRTYHNPAAEESILYAQANGTGTFRLESWTGDQAHLVRHDSYWRQQPAWDGGPAGPAALDAVVIRNEPSWAARRDALLAGSADLVEVPITAHVELDPYLWGVYDGYEDADPTLVHPTGTLRLYRELPSSALTPAQINHTLVPTDNWFIGSGALDGAGIPPDFFSDVDVRRGLNYAFDWAALFDTAYGGEALHVPGPIPYGVLGYSAVQPFYPYSPTLAAAAFQQAWGGQVWTEGFSMTIAWNEGNTTRQAWAELLKQGIEALNPNFHVQVVSMPWADLLSYRREGKLPVYIGGWLEDYHHPHNWVYPFLHRNGAYARVQNFAPDLQAVFDPRVEACALLADPELARPCYQELQSLAHEHAVGVYAIQALERRYLRTEVRGFYFRPGMWYPDYYALSKGLPPAQAPVTPDGEPPISFPHASGTATTTVHVPSGAVTESIVLVHTPDVAVGVRYVGGTPVGTLDRAPDAAGLMVGGFSFALDACAAGDCRPDCAFAVPVTLTLEYDQTDVASLIKDRIYLYVWDGAAWTDVTAECGLPTSVYQRDPVENMLTVPVCRVGTFVLAGETHSVYLPLVAR